MNSEQFWFFCHDLKNRLFNIADDSGFSHGQFYYMVTTYSVTVYDGPVIVGSVVSLYGAIFTEKTVYQWTCKPTPETIVKMQLS